MSLERYLSDIRRLHAPGSTPENAYVPALVEYLKASVEPDVIPWPRGEAVGLPDIGLRARGLIEGCVEAEALMKPLDGNKHGQEQAARYSLEPPTLLTNFSEFRLLDAGEEVRRYSLSLEELLEAPIAAVLAAHESILRDFLHDWASRHTPIRTPEALTECLSVYVERVGLSFSRRFAVS